MKPKIFTRAQRVYEHRCVGVVIHDLESDLDVGIDLRVHLWWWRLVLHARLWEKK